ncbi:MAG: hypothetical protein AAFX99_18310 [Myxococcota bacterium]
MFRTGPHLLRPKVVWRDMGTRLEAVALPACVELGDGLEQPVIPLNTVYYIPTTTYAQALVLAAWLNATSVRQRAGALAERAAHGYRRFFSWVIALLPVPEAIDAMLQPGGWEAALEAHPELVELLTLSGTLHQNPDIEGGQVKVDALVQALYGGGR